MNPSVFVWSNNNLDRLGSHLSGFLITDREVVIGQAGLSKYIAENKPVEALTSSKNGKFVLAIRSEKGVKIHSDCFGLEPIFYFQSGGKWVISNSFYALSKELPRLDVRQEFYAPSLAMFSLAQQGLFSGQLMSNNTMLSGVRLLPLGKSIYIDFKTGFHLESLDETAADSHPDTYQEAIYSFLRSAHMRMRTIAELTLPDSFVDLSGGQDSRLVFGLVAKSPRMSKSVFVRSNKGMDDDYKIASKVCDFYGMKLKAAPFLGKKICGASAFDLWALANAGVYRPIYVPITDRPRHVFQFNGANFLGKAYLTKSVSERLKSWEPHVSREAFSLISSEFYSSFQDIGVPIESDEAMSMHYMHHRARIHYGRSWFSQLFWRNHSPLLSSEFLKVATIGVGLGYSKDRIMCDVMSAVDRKLVELPFSNEKSQFLSTDIAQSAKTIRPFDFSEDTELTVYGDIPVFEDSEEGRVEEPSFEEVFKSNFNSLKSSVRAIGAFTPKFIEEAESALQRTKNVKEWDNASTIVSVGLLLKNM